MSYQYEIALRQYIAAFDGTNNISQEEFKSRFDNLHHKDYTFHASNGNTLTREQMYERHEAQFSSGSKVTLIHFRKLGLDCFDVKIALDNGEKHMTIRKVTTISDKRAVVAKEIDESPEANFFYLTPTSQVCKEAVKSVGYKWTEFGTFGTNM
jgi:hypothetical protein